MRGFCFIPFLDNIIVVTPFEPQLFKENVVLQVYCEYMQMIDWFFNVNVCLSEIPYD